MSAGALRRPRAILFDLDDTLITPRLRPQQAWSEALRAVCGDVAGLHPDTAVAAIQGAAAEFWSDPARHQAGRLDLDRTRREIIAAALGDWPDLSSDQLDQVADRYGTEQTRITELLPGSLEALAALRDGGIRLALVTNGAAAPQRAKVERFGLAGCFEHVQIEGEAGVGKPESAAYRKALAALGAAAEEAWMVGDNLEWEVMAPQRLGIQGIWRDPVGDGLPSDAEARPDLVIRSVGELIGPALQNR